jgi:hypothetical protein
VNTSGLVNDNFLVYNSGTDCWDPSTNLTYDNYRMTINCTCPSGTAGLTVIGDGRSTLISQAAYGDPDSINSPGSRPLNRLVFFAARGSQTSPSGLNIDDEIFIIRGDAYNTRGTLNDLGGVDHRTARIRANVSSSGTHYSGSTLNFETSTGGLSGLFDNTLKIDDRSSISLNRANTPHDFSYDFDQASLRILAESVAGSGLSKPTRIILDKVSEGGTAGPRLTLIHNSGTVDNPQPFDIAASIGDINFVTLTNSGINTYYHTPTDSYRTVGTTVSRIRSFTNGLGSDIYPPTRIVLSRSSGPASLDKSTIFNSDGTLSNNGRITAGANNVGIQWSSNPPVTALETYNQGSIPATGVIYNSIQWVHGIAPSGNDNSFVRGIVCPTQMSIPSGAINSGSLIGIDVASYRNSFKNFADDGQLNKLFGINIGYGHTIAGSGTTLSTNYCIGLNITPVAARGTIDTSYDILINNTVYDIIVDGSGTIISGNGTINNRYGIYQVSNNPNYFNGSITSLNYIQSDNIKLDGNIISTENTNGNLILSANGVGSIQTDPSGDARGQYAIDLQKTRSSSTQVASGNYSIILGGRSNLASGSNSICYGRENITISPYGIACGFGSKARLYAEQSSAGGYFAQIGDAQKSTAIVRKYIPSNSTDIDLTLDGASLSSTNCLILPTQTVWSFNIKLSIYDVVSDGAASYNISGCIKRTPSTTALVGTLSTSQFIDSSLTGLSYTVYADTTYDALGIRVNSMTDKNLRCVGVVEISQCSFGTP